MATKKITLNELRSLVKQIIKEEEKQYYNIRLTYEELKTLKEALLAAEVVRDREFSGAGKKFEDLHILIDKQIKTQ